MGNLSSSTINKVNYEDMQYIVSHPSDYILINTMTLVEQGCLIKNTMPLEREEHVINQCLSKGLKDYTIVIYGKNCNDESPYHKYKQLVSLGFYQVYVYCGGMFEWLLLQDIYGEQEFKTTSKELNLLKYKPVNILFDNSRFDNTRLLEY